MIENLAMQRIETERDPNLIGLFPGSRLREVRKIFPVMIEATRLLLKTKQGRDARCEPTDQYSIGARLMRKSLSLFVAAHYWPSR